ncbi:TetR family transcriptional regulator C-terminal domain-containing protein [Kitasatospora sp. NPDC087861]|uniref:TetR family transcriptional regulator C-terminal domain-containing protein n=1 Tax=Kitasatospora sp. NPDC087861 TaxID=3364070 RepID=UPI0038176675
MAPVPLDHRAEAESGADCAREWREVIVDALAQARATGGLRPDTDLGDLAFALIAVLETANAQAVLDEEDIPYQRAGRLLLRAEATDPADPVLAQGCPARQDPPGRP